MRSMTAPMPTPIYDIPSANSTALGSIASANSKVLKPVSNNIQINQIMTILLKSFVISPCFLILYS